jgi:hypothetical protein
MSTGEASQSRVEIQELASKQPNRFTSVMKKASNGLGFSKTYNFPLCMLLCAPLVYGTNLTVFIFGGSMLGFSVAHFSYLNIGGSAKSSFASRSAPGEWYHYRAGHYRIGITLHLTTILPAGLLMVWQFVPLIRHKFLLFHRINGYLIMLLIFISNAGSLMIARRAFGGTLEIQAAVGSLVVMITISLGMAYYNIKRLQIDQHRAWMLRTMFYLGTIITLRLIMALSAIIITKLNASYYGVMPCSQITFINNAKYTESHYPQCSNVIDNPNVIVRADYNARGGEHVGVALGVSFGMAWWLAILMHLVGVELYLALTPAESERLRKVSYEKQLEAGFENPGSSGLVVERWGDAKAWEPEVVQSLAAGVPK